MVREPDEMRRPLWLASSPAGSKVRRGGVGMVGTVRRLLPLSSKQERFAMMSAMGRDGSPCMRLKLQEAPDWLGPR